VTAPELVASVFDVVLLKSLLDIAGPSANRQCIICRRHLARPTLTVERRHREGNLVDDDVVGGVGPLQARPFARRDAREVQRLRLDQTPVDLGRCQIPPLQLGLGAREHVFRIDALLVERVVLEEVGVLAGVVSGDRRRVRHVRAAALRVRRRLNIEQLQLQRSAVQAVPTPQQQMVRVGPALQLFGHLVQQRNALCGHVVSVLRRDLEKEREDPLEPSRRSDFGDGGQDRQDRLQDAELEVGTRFVHVFGTTKKKSIHQVPETRSRYSLATHLHQLHALVRDAPLAHEKTLLEQLRQVVLDHVEELQLLVRHLPVVAPVPDQPDRGEPIEDVQRQRHHLVGGVIHRGQQQRLDEGVRLQHQVPLGPLVGDVGVLGGVDGDAQFVDAVATHVELVLVRGALPQLLDERAGSLVVEALALGGRRLVVGVFFGVDGADVQQQRPVPRLEQLGAGEGDDAALLRQVQAGGDVDWSGEDVGVVRPQVLLADHRVVGPLLEHVYGDGLVHRELDVLLVADTARVLSQQRHLHVRRTRRRLQTEVDVHVTERHRTRQRDLEDVLVPRGSVGLQAPRLRVQITVGFQTLRIPPLSLRLLDFAPTGRNYGTIPRSQRFELAQGVQAFQIEQRDDLGRVVEAPRHLAPF
jgi:hypothetical protein